MLDGRTAVGADCNRCNGPASVSGSRLIIGPALACTRAFCQSAPFDGAFLRILTGETTATVVGDTLLLRSERGTLRFRK